MTAKIRDVAEECTRASDEDRMSFPQVLGALVEAGIEGYLCDLRRATKTYYLPDGTCIETAAAGVGRLVAEPFDAAAVESAVRRSQGGTQTYREFCERVAAAGCAGYLVSLPGRRVLYFGRTGDTHTEHFPAAP
ncbi:MAG TPA: DUF1398 family protein [Rhizomicrobium sp.]